LAVASVYIQLQDTFLYYYLNFIYNIYNEESNYIIKKYSSFAFLNFIRNASYGERTIIPVLN